MGLCSSISSWYHHLTVEAGEWEVDLLYNNSGISIEVQILPVSQSDSLICSTLPVFLPTQSVSLPPCFASPLLASVPFLELPCVSFILCRVRLGIFSFNEAHQRCVCAYSQALYCAGGSPRCCFQPPPSHPNSLPLSRCRTIMDISSRAWPFVAQYHCY